MSFASLKKASTSSLSNLKKELEKMQAPSYSEDERFWYPSVDKAGNGYAVIRFLPPADGEDVPFIRIWEHGFKDAKTGQWYIENSRTTLGGNEKDPVTEYNSKLWNTGLEADKKLASHQKRNLRYIANIVVVEDPANPENNGKVKLFKFGPKVFAKLEDASNPPFPDQEPFNPFDLWTGANLKLKIRKVEGFRNYDSSEFGPTGPLSEDDSKMEALWKQTYPLQPFLDPKNFKSYEELEKRFLQVIGKAGTSATNQPTAAELAAAENPTQEAKAAPVKEAVAPIEAPAEEPDEDLAFFEKLANDSK